MLASDAGAMLTMAWVPSLVPWKPVIEQRLGQQIAATCAVWRVSMGGKVRQSASANSAYFALFKTSVNSERVAT